MATKKKTKEAVTQEPEVNEVVTPVETEPVETEPVEKPVVKDTVGTITGCVRLRIREAANLDGKVLCELEAGSKVKVDLSKSTNEWYKVYVKAPKVEGFCMKKYITIQ